MPTNGRTRTFQSASPQRCRRAQQRLVLLKQRQRELQIEFSQSHASLEDTEALEAELIAVAAEVADLESVLVPDVMAKVA